MWNELETARWQGPQETLVYDDDGIRERLRDLEQPCYVVQDGVRSGVTHAGRRAAPDEEGLTLLAALEPQPKRHARARLPVAEPRAAARIARA